MIEAATQYAVIEIRMTMEPPERFVIAYSDEEALRDLVAARNIVGCGFTDRDDAQARISMDIPQTA